MVATAVELATTHKDLYDAEAEGFERPRTPDQLENFETEVDHDPFDEEKMRYLAPPLRPRTESLFSRHSVASHEANPHSETVTFKVLRSAVLSQPLISNYFDNPFPLVETKDTSTINDKKKKARKDEKKRDVNN